MEFLWRQLSVKPLTRLRRYLTDSNITKFSKFSFLIPRSLFWTKIFSSHLKEFKTLESKDREFRFQDRHFGAILLCF